MSENVQETASRIHAKIGLVAERQAQLVNRLEAEQAENSRLRAQVSELSAEISRLKTDIEYLTVMRAVAPTPQQAELGRAKLAGLVREIDRCIAELKAC